MISTQNKSDTVKVASSLNGTKFYCDLSIRKTHNADFLAEWMFCNYDGDNSFRTKLREIEEAS